LSSTLDTFRKGSIVFIKKYLMHVNVFKPMALNMLKVNSATFVMGGTDSVLVTDTEVDSATSWWEEQTLC
jgi:hypothetical protein